MAWTSGTALHYRDLLDRVIQFLTMDLLPLEQRWSVLRNTTTPLTHEVILKAPGFSPTQDILVGVRSDENATADTYGWELNGFMGYNPLASFYTQPGAMVAPLPMLSLWNAPIPYWFIADARHVVVIAKISTVYEAAYLGFMEPYATPGQYPYPLFIGGSLTGQRGRHYSLTGPNHRHFVDPGEDTQNNANTAAMLKGPSGSWLAFQNVQSGESRYDGPRPMWPTNHGALGNVREALDGSYVLSPIVLSQYNAPTDHDCLGELHGVYWVSGFNNAVENRISVNGVDHFVVQNVYRTGVRDYWAVALEA